MYLMEQKTGKRILKLSVMKAAALIQKTTVYRLNAFSLTVCIFYAMIGTEQTRQKWSDPP